LSLTQKLGKKGCLAKVSALDELRTFDSTIYQIKIMMLNRQVNDAAAIFILKIKASVLLYFFCPRLISPAPNHNCDNFATVCLFFICSSGMDVLSIFLNLPWPALYIGHIDRLLHNPNFPNFCVGKINLIL